MAFVPCLWQPLQEAALQTRRESEGSTRSLSVRGGASLGVESHHPQFRGLRSVHGTSVVHNRNTKELRRNVLDSSREASSYQPFPEDVSELEDVDRRFAAVQLTRSWCRVQRLMWESSPWPWHRWRRTLTSLVWSFSIGCEARDHLRSCWWFFGHPWHVSSLHCRLLWRHWVDKKEKKNVEMMEEGRGSEYGCPGGQGGEGVVVVAFRGKQHGGEDGGTHMVVKAHGKAKLEAAASGVSYGGYAKACYKLEHSGDLVPIDEFVVSSSTSSAIVSFDGDDAEEVAASAAKQLPAKANAAGYFPCFCRGYNKYMADGVEPEAFASGGLNGVPLFGMFAHGELGPSKGVPVAVASGEAPETGHDVHSSTSILALYA